MDSDHFLVIGKSTGEVIYHKCCLMVAFCRKNCLTQGGNMDEQEKKYQDLFTELTNYERSGVRMQMNCFPASPLQIVTAHMVKEAGTYMRDYTMSGDGNIETLRFTDINEHFRAEITP